ncbi:DUF86 domain-containing protein [uncultured Methanomethylovorans sp.]|uniref:HepT-like ribonuclease domain-containing protein n=1 Tax=uncultured Methanomethylovorans sp. TaxID=183759 RepID=UPI00260FF250|nr:DUF86 domain-containing protein [uncultured Methanomethylovorans sp.]
MKHDAILLDHILDAINQIEEYTNGIDREEFLETRMVQDAVVRQLEILGEAAKAIPENIKSLVPDLPWSRIAGMRDRLIHAYFIVDYNLVWDTVEN